jgi:DNA-binding transcriptional ArsR family regulator
MRIRIEVDDKGMKSVYEFESLELAGEDLRDKIVSYLAASGVFAEKEASSPSVHSYESTGTLMDKLEKFIRFEFPDIWFTSQQLRDKYETVSDDIKLSTVSTYLSRMNRDGLLDRRGNRNNRQYRLLAETASDLSGQEVVHAKKRSAEGRW